MRLLPELKSDENRAKDTEALKAALVSALAPVMSEIGETIREMRKISDKSSGEFNAAAVTFAIERLNEAVKKLAEEAGPGDTSSERVAAAAMGFSAKKQDEQLAVLKEMLKNSKFQNEITKEMSRTVAEDLYRSMDRLVEISTMSDKNARRAALELLKNEKERERRESRSRSESRSRNQRQDAPDKTMLEKLLSFLNKPSQGFIASIIDGVQKVAFGIGLVGLVSLIPKKFREFIGDYVGAFTTIRVLLKNSWLAPLFKILESIPILGAIVKKLPYLSAVLAAFEILPKVAEEFQKNGIWSAAETALQGIYDFFVGDLVKLVATFADNVKEGLFGKKIAAMLDFSAWADTFNAGVGNVVTDLVDFVKQFFVVLTSGVDDGSLDKIAWKLVRDVVDGYVAGIRALFKFNPEDDFSLRAAVEDTWTSVAESVKSFMDDVKRWVSGGATPQEKMAVYDAFKYVVYDLPMEALSANGRFLLDSMSSFAANLKSKITESLGSLEEYRLNLRQSFVDFVTQTWDKASDALTKSVDDVIAAGINIKDDVEAWLRSIWKAVADWTYDNTVGMIPGLGRSETSSPEVSTPTPRMENISSNIKKLSVAETKKQQAWSSPAAVMNQNNRTSHVTNFSVVGGRRVSPMNPNRQSTGGGGGF